MFDHQKLSAGYDFFDFIGYLNREICEALGYIAQ